MPKTAPDVLVADNGNERTSSFTVGQPDGSKTTASYTVPSNPAKWQAAVLEMSDTAPTGEESPLALAYRLYCIAVRDKARQAVYEQAAQESTYKVIAGQRKNLLDFPLAGFIRAYNGFKAQVELLTMAGTDEAAAEKSIGFGPFRATANRHIADGKARDNGGVLEAV